MTGRFHSRTSFPVQVDREREWESGFQGTTGREIRGFGIIGEMDITFQGLSKEV